MVKIEMDAIVKYYWKLIFQRLLDALFFLTAKSN